MPTNRKETRRIYRNIIVISVAFMLHFTAFSGTSVLQSSVNKVEGLGTVSLVAIYAALIAGSLFLPQPVIRKLGCKWTMAVSLVTYMPYIAAQFHATFYTLVPAGILVGLGAATLWVAKATYLSLATQPFSEASGLPVDVLTTRFSGIFFAVFAWSQIFGNIISSTVFSFDTHLVNNRSGDLSGACGANFLAVGSFGQSLEQPSLDKIYILGGIYLLCMVLACVSIAVGVDPIYRSKKEEQNTLMESSAKKKKNESNIMSTLKLLKEPKQLLILPIVAFTGMEQAFSGADFTVSYVTCGWGVQNVGYVMMSYGVGFSVISLSSGLLVKLTGRLPVVSCVAVFQVAILGWLLGWKVHADDRLAYFLVAAALGVCCGVWTVQIKALCGIMFPGREEAAYSNFMVWNSAGFIIGYAYSAHIVTWAKIAALFVGLAIGFPGYVAAEIIIKRTEALSSNPV